MSKPNQRRHHRSREEITAILARRLRSQRPVSRRLRPDQPVCPEHVSALAIAPCQATKTGRRRCAGSGGDHRRRFCITCKRLGINPAEYPVDVITPVATHPNARISELTPRGWKELREKIASPA